MIHRISFFLLLSVLIIACKTTEKKPFGKDPALENITWELQRFNGEAVNLSGGLKPITLTFEGQSNTFGGSAGCNQCNGMYTTQDEMIKLHKMAVTQMACPDMKLEQQYLEAMDKVTNYKITHKKQGGVVVQFLYLYIEKTEVAQFQGIPEK